MGSSADLSGKVILVTGASRGIGHAVSLAAAQAGADVIITGRTVGALEELDDAIKASGAHATIVEHDMSDFAALPRLAAVIHERWRRLDNTQRPHSALGYRPPAPETFTPQAPQQNASPNSVCGTDTGGGSHLGECR